MFKWILKLMRRNKKEDTRMHSGSGGSCCLIYKKPEIKAEVKSPNWYYVDFKNHTVFYDPKFNEISAAEIFAKNKKVLEQRGS